MTKNNMTYKEFLKLHVRESEQLIRETPAYLLTKRQSEYTVEDYYNMPDATTIYGFESQIPVGIFDGKCKVDFARISKKIEKF